MREPIGDSATVGAFERADLENIGLNPRFVRTLESLPDSRDIIVTQVNNVTSDLNEVEVQPILLWDDATDPTAPILENTRKLTGSSNITAVPDPAAIVLDLTDTGVAAGSYGSATRLLVLGVDAKGRVVSASDVALESGNVTETTKLFFTTSRARQSISGTGNINYDNTTGIISFSGTGVSTTVANPTSVTVVDGLITAIS